jgi:hypothetical protein
MNIRLTSTILLFCSVFIIFLIISCDQSTDVVDPVINTPNNNMINSPGKLSFVYMKGLAKESTDFLNINTQNAVTFDLGDIKASRDFYFLLKNTGGSDITNITLESDHSMFQISPATIDTLIPDSLFSFVAVIRISAIHGVALDGVGPTDLMPMDENRANISINGTTTNENEETIEVSFEATLIVNALVMDIELSYNQTILDIAKPIQVTASGEWPAIGWVRAYRYPFDATLQITNNGNVDIDVKLYDSWDASSPIATFILSPNSSSDLILNVHWDNPAVKEGMLVLDGNNTITDVERLQPSEDGRVYLYLEQWADQ